MRRPATPPAIQARFAALHRLFVNKWYFDEAIDVALRPPVRLVRALRPADVRARRSSNGALVGGTTGVVRAGSAAVRALQSGFLRYYAALLLVGLARREPLLPDLRMSDAPDHPALLPLALGAPRPAAARRGARVSRRSARWPLAYAICSPFDFETRRGGLQYVTDEPWISELGIHYKLGVDGLNLCSSC